MKSSVKAAIATLVCAIVLAALPLPALPARPHQAAYRFVNGRWFDGRTFENRVVYSVNGIFRSKHAGKIDDTIDLHGRFVIPPFAEAHNHHFMEGMDNKSQIDTYLSQGIFYAKNPNSLQKLTDPVRPSLNLPTSVDVVFSNGGLTARGGHPIQIYDFLGERGMLPGMSQEDMRNQAYFVIDTEADLEAQWALIRAGRPDFIKTYLEYSEEYEARKSDPRYYGRRGLNPALLPKIVGKAHRDDLRVSVHVNTAADFRAAVAAGADEISHLPLVRLTARDARLAAARGVVVVTTTLSHRKTDHVAGLDDVHRHNLQLLDRAGVRLAVGTDDNGRTARDEAENLHRLKVFDNLALLKMWTEATPLAIFPHRRVGRLADGYEASFLALEGNPVADFSNVRKIGFRFKQGHMVEVREGAVTPENKKRPAAAHP